MGQPKQYGYIQDSKNQQQHQQERVGASDPPPRCPARPEQDAPTYLAGGHHVSVLGVLVHREAEDVIRVLQVEALAPWEGRGG